MALLAISGIDGVTSTLRDDGQGAVVVHARNDSESPGLVTILVSEGLDFNHAVGSVMYHARNMVSDTYAVPQNMTDSEQQLGVGRTTRWQPEWYDGLGFCTWNALGPKLSEEKVLDAVKELARNKIHITNLILDDNWQSLERIESDESQYGWAEFEADHQAFPNGLKNLVTRIRKLHPDIQNVLVWHALLGYWGGIAPKGLIAKTYETVRVAQEDDGTKNTLTVVGKADVSRLYDDFYKFLSESGIDGVKADAQVMVDLLTAAPDRRELMSTYLHAWSAASQRYFGAKTISCMSQFPHALFSSQLPRRGREIIVGNSDDFFPDIPRSHPWHVWANAHNAILTQFLNAVPDWDMFQTSHEYSGFHGAARCVSGGPIYITDIPGEHDMKIIKEITATTPLGQTVILRPSVLGKSISAYAGYDDDSLLKIGSYNGASETGTGILGVFNVSERRISELVPLELFPGVLEGATYIIRAHTTGKTSLPMCKAAPRSLITISLDETGYEILCAYPVTPYQSDRYGDGHVGVIGLVDKMTGCAAVAASTVIQRANGRVAVTCNIRALGTLGVYISTLPQLNIADDFMVAVEDQPVPVEMVRRSDDNGKVFEIDVGKVWRQRGTSTAQRSEILVKVSFQA